MKVKVAVSHPEAYGIHAIIFIIHSALDGWCGKYPACFLSFQENVRASILDWIHQSGLRHGSEDSSSRHHPTRMPGQSVQSGGRSVRTTDRLMWVFTFTSTWPARQREQTTEHSSCQESRSANISLFWSLRHEGNNASKCLPRMLRRKGKNKHKRGIKIPVSTEIWTHDGRTDSKPASQCTTAAQNVLLYSELITQWCK